ncbi:CPCC family cysteine-rich protein [Streptomyces griseoviridis]|uniref:CPCC family cysteine-rich protein n=1 Tax=Streptomyces griseoviridis TaxID=45398 RepID=UPI0033FE4A59
MPGSCQICSVCFPKDDGVQFGCSAAPFGTNRATEAQRNCQDFGACDQRGRQYARAPTAYEPLAPPGVSSTRLATPSRTGRLTNAPRGPTATRCSPGGSPPSSVAATRRHDVPYQGTCAAARRRGL